MSKEETTTTTESKEERLFARKYLGKLKVSEELVVRELKEKIYNEFLHSKQLGEHYSVESAEEIRLRNPKNDDLGDILNDAQKLQETFLFDGKELLVQKSNTQY